MEEDILFTEEELLKFIISVVNDLNQTVFLKVYKETLKKPYLRNTLNPAFPYPKELKIAIIKDCLAVEYVGPEIEDEDAINISGGYYPDKSVLDFLNIDLSHINTQVIPCNESIYDVSFFLGDSLGYLCDYFYDITQIPSGSFFLNGYIDISNIDKPICISNTNFFWTDKDGRLKIRHIDFLEIFPRLKEGIGYHDEKSLQHFSNFIVNLQVPKYNVDVHRKLNEFIHLINLTETSEVQITKYLEDNPEILQISFGAHKLNSQKILKWQYSTDKSDLKPDFLIERMDGFVDILEFKLPRIKTTPIVGTMERRQPSFEIDSAIAQVNLYNEWCLQDINRQWAEIEYGIKIMHPVKYLVIGHSNDFTAEDRQRLRSSRDTIIFTYDEFIEMARFQIYRIR